ncbi:hypothetical protein BP6252_09904 [Coleophoma cylindrospora]|uniref:Uncharacterized protein n=1 Tax=Coleophoma cylindrospora TaxID=1849047 RepID=A0A3D8QWY5_9HELO|nr:hypothetical protein BP6252_09904 [Coleophoma cylindrospora]
MDVFYAYTYGTFSWMALQAAPLIISPTIIITLLSPEVREPTALEEYFSRALGMSLLALGIIIVLLTGSVPLTSSISDTKIVGVSSEDNDPTAPYAVPTLTLSMLYHSAAAFLCYARFTTTHQTTFVLGSIGSGSLAVIGLWCILFATSSGKISRKTGADKRTSGFPFSNKESASSRKKAAKKEKKGL